MPPLEYVRQRIREYGEEQARRTQTGLKQGAVSAGAGALGGAVLGGPAGAAGGAFFGGLYGYNYGYLTEEDEITLQDLGTELALAFIPLPNVPVGEFLKKFLKPAARNRAGAPIAEFKGYDQFSERTDLMYHNYNRFLHPFSNDGVLNTARLNSRTAEEFQENILKNYHNLKPVTKVMLFSEGKLAFDKFKVRLDFTPSTSIDESISNVKHLGGTQVEQMQKIIREEQLKITDPQRAPRELFYDEGRPFRSGSEQVAEQGRGFTERIIDDKRGGIFYTGIAGNQRQRTYSKFSELKEDLKKDPKVAATFKKVENDPAVQRRLNNAFKNADAKLSPGAKFSPFIKSRTVLKYLGAASLATTIVGAYMWITWGFVDTLKQGQLFEIKKNTEYLSNGIITPAEFNERMDLIDQDIAATKQLFNADLLFRWFAPQLIDRSVDRAASQAREDQAALSSQGEYFKGRREQTGTGTSGTGRSKERLSAANYYTDEYGDVQFLEQEFRPQQFHADRLDRFQQQTNLPPGLDEDERIEFLNERYYGQGNRFNQQFQQLDQLQYAEGRQNERNRRSQERDRTRFENFQQRRQASLNREPPAEGGQSRVPNPRQPDASTATPTEIRHYLERLRRNRRLPDDELQDTR